MDSKKAKELLRSNPPNIPDSHWESIVHRIALDESARNSKITLVNANSAEMLIDTMTGNVIVTLILNTSIETVNNVLNAFDVPTTGWSIKE